MKTQISKFLNLVRICSCSMVVLALAVSLDAQSTGGTILGRMEDQSGAVIAGGKATVTNQDTGVSREVVTNASGLFLVPDLLPGSYSVAGAAQGFGQEMVKGVTVDVGSQITVNLRMQVGTVGQNIVVEASTANVDLATAEITSVVATKTITELPLNGRDWTQLAQLEPGIAQVRSQNTTDSNRAQRGNGVDLSISGGRPSSNNYRLNGISLNDYANTAPGSAIGTNLGVDAIQEFSIESSTPAAEFGKLTGGILNAVTRSGTNQFHGSVYYFLRNSALDARNYFDVGSSPLPFRRNNYGASAGGHLKKNKTFWFVDFEGLRESLSSTVLSTVPSSSIRSTAVTSVQPFLAFFPLPNGPIASNGQTGSYIFASKRQSHDDFITGKFDHRFSERDSVNVAYQWDNGGFNAPDALNNELIGSLSRRNDITFEESHIFSPTAFNSLRAGFARTHASNNSIITEDNKSLSDSSLSFIPGRQVGGITISGVTTFVGGVNGPDPNDFHFNSYQIYDDFTWVHGIHTLKAGFSFERQQNNFFAGFTTDGSFTFASIANFMANIPTTFSGLLPGSDNTRGIRQSIAGGYLQDSIRLGSGLTVNLGVRYEIATVPSEVNGKMASLHNVTDAAPTVGPMFANPTLKDFSPRIGMAWDPFHDGKTSIRAGFGIYDALPLGYEFVNRFPRTPPFFLAGSANYTAGKSPANFFPNGAFGQLNPSSLRTIYIQPNPPRSFVTQFNVSVQRQITPSVLATAAYVASRGYNLYDNQDGTDVAMPATTSPFTWLPNAPTVNPAFARIAGSTWNLPSWYNAAQLGVKKSLSKGLSAQLAWTYQKSVDQGSATFSTNEFTNTMNNPLGIFFPQLNQGLSDFNVRNLFVVHLLYDIPTPAGWNGAAKGLLGGWELGTIFTSGSGLPFSVMLNNDRAGTGNSLTSVQLGERPNYVNGCQTTNPGNVQFVNTACFTFPAQYTLGNLGRNALEGPGLQDVDFSLFKTVNARFISEAFRVQFRAEIFNFLNHTNFALPDSTHTTMWNGSGVLNGNAGQLTLTQTPSRQIQFGMKLLW